MNKYEKALFNSVDRACKEDYEILKVLVQKASPKKPIEKLVDFYCGEIPSEKEIHYYCECDEWVGTEGIYQNYCLNCGQAIDWSDIE